MIRRSTGLTSVASLALVLAAPMALPAAAAPAAAPAAAGVDSTSLRAALGLGTTDTLVARSTVRSADGAVVTRYDRRYRGLRVIGGDLVVRTKNGAKEATYNLRKSVAVASVNPTVAATTARSQGARALAAVGATRTATTTSELVVVNTKAGARLAYDVVSRGTKADQTPTRLHTVVDARNGRVLQRWDDIKTGTGDGIYDRGVTFGTTPASGLYQLKDAAGNYTTDLANRTRGTGTLMTDADDTWGNGSYTDRASAGVDAQYGAEKTFDFYKNTLGRAGIWGTGKGAPSRVHYGRAYVNAFWDGTQMTYGDGANNAAPLTELDVAGHEMSHGVTEHTANLTYSGESGGLNEATSDIFGTAVEWYANLASDTPDYLIGEKIGIGTNGGPLRFMDKPSRDGKSPDCYSSTIGSLNVHYSSGPLNHWYYLLSEGSGAKTINGVAYNSPVCGGAAAVTGIGHQAAEKIWYDALSTRLTSSSGYLQARDAATLSAKAIYGTNSAQCLATVKAFDAIAAPKGTATCA